MTETSVNGSQPDDSESDKRTPFERFEQLTKRLLNTPKEQLNGAPQKTKRTRASR